MTIAEAVQKIKANSSRWMSEQDMDFEWQKGYAAFAVSSSLLDTVKTYIATQDEHHRGRTFEAELLTMLRKSGVTYDPQS